jgi:hypothetical protein
VRPRVLEVEEVLGVDVREARGAPELGEVPGGERRALAAVVPAPERADEEWPLERGPLGDAKGVGDGTESTYAG